MSENLGEGVLQVTGDASGAIKAIDDTQNRLGASIFIFRTAGYALQSIGQAALSGFSTASQAASDFNQTLVKTQNLTSIADFDIKRVHDSLLQMATDTGQAPIDLANGFYYAASVLNNLDDALAVTQAAAKGSTIGLGNMTDVTRTLTSVMNVYGLQAGDVNHLMDTLIIMVKDGAGEADAFAGAIGRIIPIAKVAGVSFDDVAAALSTATRAGLSVDEATTALTRTLTELIGSTANTNKEFMTLGFSQDHIDDAMQHLAATTSSISDRLEKYGVKGKDVSKILEELTTNHNLAESSMRKLGLTSAEIANVEQTQSQAVSALRQNLIPYGLSLQDIDSVLKAYTKDQQEGELALGKFGISSQQIRDTLKGPDGLYNALTLIQQATGGNEAELRKLFPNIRGFLGILSTASTQGAEYKSILDEMSGATNTLSNDFKRTADTQAYAAQQTEATKKALEIKVGEATAPALIALYKALIPVLKAISDFATQHPKAFQIIADGLFAMAAGVYALGAAFQATAGLIAIQRSFGWIIENAPKVAVVSAALEGLGTVVEGAGALLLGTFGAVVAIIAGVILIGYLLITHWKQLSDTVKGLGELIGKFFVIMWGKARDAVGGFFSSVGSAIHEKLSAIWTAVTSSVVAAWKGITTAITTGVSNAIGGIVAFFKNIPNMIVAALRGAAFMVGEVIGLTIKNAITSFMDIVKFFQDLPVNLASLITAGAHLLREAFDAVVTGIKEAIKKQLTLILDIFGGIVTGLIYFKEHFKEIVSDAWTAVITFVKGKLHDFLDMNLKGFGQILDFLHNVFSGQMLDKIGEIMDSVKTAFKNNLHDILNMWLNIFGAIVSFLQSIGPTLMNIAKDLGNSFWQGLKQGLGISSPSFAERAFFAISDAATNAVGDVQDAIKVMNAATPAFAYTARAAVAGLPTSANRSGVNSTGNGGTVIGEMTINNPQQELDLINAFQRAQWLARMGDRGITVPPQGFPPINPTRPNINPSGSSALRGR